MILYNEFEPFSKLVNSEFYNDFETFSKLVHENGNENGNENVSTNKILGSLEILAIKNELPTHLFMSFYQNILKQTLKKQELALIKNAALAIEMLKLGLVA